jgi:hypothetical protein
VAGAIKRDHAVVSGQRRLNGLPGAVVVTQASRQQAMRRIMA